VADSAGSDSLIKSEPQAPAPDPITGRSTSAWVLISALALMAVLGWALYDEVYGLRPWKSMQQQFVERENAFLRRTKRQAKKSEAEIKASPEFQQIAADAKAARGKIAPVLKEKDTRVKEIDSQLQAITEPFQAKRGEISLDNYRIETSKGSDKQKWIKRRDQSLNEKISVDMPIAPGSAKTQTKVFTFPEIDRQFTDLKAEKARLLAERAEVSKEASELAKKQEDYLKEHLTGLSEEQIGKLQERNDKFDFSMRQINLGSTGVVDRCETCHLGVREPLTLTPASMTLRGEKQDSLSRAFVSHPNKELLQVHSPDRFGCAACHGGNGRATTSVEKGHGKNPFWLHPLHAKENTEAGCQQCHMADRVLDGAPTLNLGKDLFQQRGCVGCHKSESFDREADALANTRQSVSQLEEQIAANERQSRLDNEAVGTAKNDIEAQRLASHAEYLRVTNSQLAARVEQLNIQSRYLMQDQKKVGPNLKDVRLKLRKEWIPEWLNDPQAFRPGTKMPTFWRLNSEMLKDKRADDERKAIAAFLWQQGFDGQLPQQENGDAARGNQLFHQIGCMACHSIGEGSEKDGGDFAANLTRVGQKASYDYIVRWIYNPRARVAPYCPKEKRDLTRKDYEDKGLPFVFDSEMHSKCPNDGAELQVQNMTVMPNFRLSTQDARDIATYLFSQSNQVPYANASYMDDPKLRDTGKDLVKQYGCAGCHEIKGFEDEQRIGKELTTEGATPLERLDFALMTGPAERGVDPDPPPRAENAKKSSEDKEWYNHKGFFEHKLNNPAIYDQGKEKDPRDRLRMPKPYLTPEWRTALTTFLLGSVGAEGANVPTSMFYNPSDRQKDIQDGWWVVKKYNCMGCHSIQPGQRSVLMDLALYQNPDWKDQLPPRLSSEGARVDPTWLLSFLKDPSLSKSPSPGSPASAAGPTATGHTQPAGTGGTKPGDQTAGIGDHAFAPQPGNNTNGVRTYLKARMPTFNFSPNELRQLVRFFMAVSSQQEPYIKEPLEPLSDQERILARQLFTSQAAPCLKCHITGDPNHDKTASAPNFLLASQRLKPEWTRRWLLDPSQISPGTAMPSGLFTKKDDRYVFSGPTPETFNDYHRDHAVLLVRYMFLMTPEEQQKLISTQPSASPPSAAPPAASASAATSAAGPPKASTAHALSRAAKSAHARARGH
jgi:cbb3-type cytochrome oxidase cytochrome c subunit/cytochrome c551/c552